jgi:hypothetical protein
VYAGVKGDREERKSVAKKSEARGESV